MTDEELKELRSKIDLELRGRKIEEVEKIVKEMNRLLKELNALGVDLNNDIDGYHAVCAFSYDSEDNEDIVNTQD